MWVFARGRRVATGGDWRRGVRMEGKGYRGGGLLEGIQRRGRRVYSTSIGRMGAGTPSSLKVANALLFPPRNSQESYLC